MVIVIESTRDLTDRGLASGVTGARGEGILDTAWHPGVWLSAWAGGEQAGEIWVPGNPQPVGELWIRVTGWGAAPVLSLPVRCHGPLRFRDGGSPQ